jgi:oxaloacetate decarboxylase alpha subunit
MPAPAPLAGNVIKLLVNVGDTVAAGDVILILEAMKMETEIRSQTSGQVVVVNVGVGDAVKVGDSLMALA